MGWYEVVLRQRVTTARDRDEVIGVARSAVAAPVARVALGREHQRLRALPLLAAPTAALLRGEPGPAAVTHQRPLGTTSIVEVLVIALLLFMAVAAAVVIVQSRGSSLLGWAVEAGAIALLLPWLAGL
jgi:hypothetical protein